jgi:hypothetical protein
MTAVDDGMRYYVSGNFDSSKLGLLGTARIGD